jgi:glycine cleavage system H protein
MTDFLEVGVGKFIFRTAIDRLYTEEGLWIKSEGENVRIGLSDFAQQRGGDIAFVNVMPVGSNLTTGSEITTLETIKVNTEFGSPVNGVIIEVNPQLQTAPEVINQDPYGAGWLAVVKVENREGDLPHLLTPERYHEVVKRIAEQEAGAS